MREHAVSVDQICMYRLFSNVWCYILQLTSSLPSVQS